VKEKDFFVALAIALFVWFNFLYFYLRDWISQNFLIAFFVFMAGFVYITMKYILSIDPIKNPKFFAAYFLIWFSFDLIMFPYLVSPQGLVTQDVYANFSTDVFAYKLVNQVGLLGYNIVFVVIPLGLLYAARQLVSRKKFFDLVKKSV
jgi:hypothetical protein